ncbi:MAG TPA: hypothetical protein VHB46_18145 [Burkholderiales bacterium]|nr:hypothetical protein [Burkholderiales bacterium]
MISPTRSFAIAAIVGVLLPGGASLAVGTRAPDIGMLGSLAAVPEHSVNLDARPHLLASPVFDIPIDGKATFAEATAKLGAAAVRRMGKDETGPRYVCYRSTRGKPAVVAVFTSQSAANEESIDGFAFGLQSAMPDAMKVCRQVPWLKAEDLKFEKVQLDMPKEKLPATLEKAAGAKPDARIHWYWKSPDATAGDTPAPAITGGFAAFTEGRLVFFYAYSATGRN